MKYLFALAALLLGACSTNYSLMADKDLTKVEERLSQKMDSLEHRINELLEENARLQRRTQADFKLLLSTLDKGNERTLARLEENQHRLEKLGKTSDQILKKEPVVQTIVSAPATDSNATTLGDLELERLYSLARADFNSENYRQAYTGFKEVYEKKSDSKLGENSLYWMAICYERSGQKDNSIIVMERVLSEYPQGAKQCTAHFQLARLYTESNEAKRVEHLKVLAESSECSGSNESYRAVEMLKDVSK